MQDAYNDYSVEFNCPNCGRKEVNRQVYYAGRPQVKREGRGQNMRTKPRAKRPGIGAALIRHMSGPEDEIHI